MSKDTLEKIEKELAEHWANTKKERERTHTNAMHKKHLKELEKKKTLPSMYDHMKETGEL